jgi:hypothetical protein
MKNIMKKSIHHNQTIKQFKKAAIALGLSTLPYLANAQDGVTGLNTANTTLKTYIAPVTTVTLVIGGLVGFVGALQVFIAWNNGEQDINKKIMGWGGSCLFLVLSSILVKAFFGL